ncbi:MAG: Hsp20/alpha crystallin family protein [Eubacterium sp.]|nr:Hsp20/alpha crystallin family protein [Eubacterium sp.]
MLIPSIFGDNFVDNFFDDVLRTPVATERPVHVMKTDIKDQGDHYLLEIELPGYKKEDLSVELHEGNLTIRASKESTTEEKDEKKNYIRRERHSGSCQRTFYVGKKLQQENIKAAYTDGVLVLTVPKESAIPDPEKQYISIEG